MIQQNIVREDDTLVHEKVYESTCPDGVRRSLSIFDLLSQFRQNERTGVLRISDLHLKCGSPPYYRINNEMMPWSDKPEDRLTDDVIRKLIIGLLSPDRRNLLDEFREIDASYAIPGACFRINIYHDRIGLAAALRVLPSRIPQVESVGFPEDAIWQDIVNLRQGLVVLTGITGSGKTTTIASLIQRINETRRTHIITLEDPIEYIFENKLSLISQRQVGRDTPSFAEGLRSILREDPDIIVVGEMRDKETMLNALNAAETGHLVFTTLHTRDTKGIITRITDMFPEGRRDEIAANLSLALSWVLAQKLIPKSSGDGRIVAMEVLRNTNAVANLIRQMQVPQVYSALQTGTNEHMCTLEKSLARLVTAGQLKPEDAIQWSNIPESFQSALRGRY